MAKVITVLSIFLALVAKNHVTAFQLLSNNVEVSKADIPSDIKGISECRRTAFPPDKPLRRPEKSFINAEAAVRESVICLVAKEQFFPWRILGTADVRIMRKGSKAIVNNVFVRKDARGRGLAKQLMMGIETVVPSTTQSISYRAAESWEGGLPFSLSGSRIFACFWRTPSSFWSPPWQLLLLLLVAAPSSPSASCGDTRRRTSSSFVRREIMTVLSQTSSARCAKKFKLAIPSVHDPQTSKIQPGDHQD